MELDRICENPDFRKYGKDISRIVPSMAKDPSKLPMIVTSQEQEFIALNECKRFLEQEFKTSIEIIKAEDSKEQKARQAMPGKPAILVS